MKQSTVWLSFDLGIQGDYEGIYRWLDERGAKECGEGLAVFKIDRSSSIAPDLKASLQDAITTDRQTRIYCVFREQSTGRNKGVFLFGGRRAAVWTGYSPSAAGVADEED
jgi:hypothetical protein